MLLSPCIKKRETCGWLKSLPVLQRPQGLWSPLLDIKCLYPHVIRLHTTHTHAHAHTHLYRNSKTYRLLKGRKPISGKKVPCSVSPGDTSSCLPLVVHSRHLNMPGGPNTALTPQFLWRELAGSWKASNASLQSLVSNGSSVKSTCFSSRVPKFSCWHQHLEAPWLHWL